MNRTNQAKHPKPRLTAQAACKTARAHRTPIYVWQNGKVVAQKSWTQSRRFVSSKRSDAATAEVKRRRGMDTNEFICREDHTSLAEATQS